MTTITHAPALGRDGYAGAAIDELPQLFDGMATLVREGLGIDAFGVQVWALEPDYTTVSHDEGDTDQQEMYVGLDGSGAVILHHDWGDEHVPLALGRVVAVGPDVERSLTSGPDGLRVLCVGAPIGRPYAPPDWTTGG